MTERSTVRYIYAVKLVNTKTLFLDLMQMWDRNKMIGQLCKVDG